MACAAPAWGKTDGGVSERERRSFEERWRTQPEVVPLLRRQLPPPINLLGPLPSEELDLAVTYQRAGPLDSAPPLAAAGETRAMLLIPPVRPELPLQLQPLVPVSINPAGPLATSGPLPYDPFNLTYEALRDSHTDCILHHEPLTRSARQPLPALACDPGRDRDRTLPGFTTR
jgi:hypothetical protein